MATFGEMQRRARLEMEWTQAELVEKLKEHGVEVTQGFIAKLEKELEPGGEKAVEPRRDYINAIAKLFNLHPMYLMGHVPNPVPFNDPSLTLSIEVPRTQETQQMVPMMDALPLNHRRTLLTVALGLTADVEVEQAKAKLTKQWEQLWALVDRVGGMVLRGKLERELGVTSESGIEADAAPISSENIAVYTEMFGNRKAQTRK